jgi:nucleoside-diphosphate-sugar epimerase
MRVLIFGCGYVGAALGAELVRLGHSVFGVRRGLAAGEELKSAGIELLAADVSRPETLEGLPRGCDWAVFCASSSGGGAEDYRRVYLDGLRNVVDWLAEAPPQMLLYTSSTGVYGQTDGSVVTENSVTEPGTETGRALVEAERMLLEESKRLGVPSVVLRLAGIYGPGRGYWLKQFLAGEARVEGAGGRVLNMIHREDVAGAVIAALQRGRAGEIYNGVDDEPVTQLELFRWLAEKLRRELPPTVPEDLTVARRRGLTSKRISNRKLKEELGYRFRHPTFREGFAALLEAGR